MKIKGIYTPVITPFRKDYGIDFGSLEKILKFLLKKKIHGIVVGGTTGEYFSLNFQERIQLFEFVKKIVGNKCQLIAGTTATVGGAAGGLAARGVVGGLAPKALTPMLGKHKNPAYNGMLDIGLEMGGGLTGDMAGQGVADALLRLKGGGTTPYEKMAAEQQKELEQQILRSYLSGKGGYPTNDYFLQENGLG